MTPQETWGQVTDSRRILEDRLACQVTSLAYPFGTLRDFNDRIKEMLHRAGYRSACTSVNGVNRHGADLLELRRTKVEQSDGPIFDKILSGGIDGWAFVDQHLSAFQNWYA